MIQSSSGMKLNSMLLKITVTSLTLSTWKASSSAENLCFLFKQHRETAKFVSIAGYINSFVEIYRFVPLHANLKPSFHNISFHYSLFPLEQYDIECD